MIIQQTEHDELNQENVQNKDFPGKNIIKSYRSSTGRNLDESDRLTTNHES